MEKNEILIKQAPHSDHYKECKIEPLAYIDANGLDFTEGNIIKLITRYRFKGQRLPDLEKARFYINWLIEREAPHADSQS